MVFQKLCQIYNCIKFLFSQNLPQLLRVSISQFTLNRLFKLWQKFTFFKKFFILSFYQMINCLWWIFFYLHLIYLIKYKHACSVDSPIFFLECFFNIVLIFSFYLFKKYPKLYLIIYQCWNIVFWTCNTDRHL